MWISAVGSEKALVLTTNAQNKVTLGATIFELNESRPPKLITSAMLRNAIAHSLTEERLDIADGSTICLTCFIGANNETNVYSRLAYVAVSDDDSSFAAKFETGYEFFEPLQIQRSAANFHQNRLTGSITDTFGEADAKLVTNHLIKPITTCQWMERQELETDIYVFAYLKEMSITNILWRSSLMTVLLRNSTISKNESVRKRRSVDVENVFIPEEQISPKVGNKDDAAKLKLKTRRLFKHAPLGLSFLVSNAVEEGKQFWMPYSTLRCLIVKKDALNSLEDNCNVLVRFWYPPNLNENHITQHAFLLIVRKNLRRSEGDNLYEKLAFALSSHERVIVGRVESWLGVCRNLYSTENPISQVALYRSLLKAVQENYHYINPDQVAVIGKRGADAHLAGLILASGHSPLLPRCGVLITPIIDYSKTVSTLAERYLKSYEENESKYIMVNLVQKPLNLLDKSIFVMHEYSDSLYSFNQTAELCRFFVKNKIDYDLQLHPCGASGTLTIEEQVSFIKEVSDFLLDCFNRTSRRWDKVPNFINRN
ncbi:unnamed protein product [Rodentolepis nana]|uniref:DUF4821 domain-containing protein n=1 Tax=Rodentolepis nana TaxID=102285 RepID=A0A0R3TM32_RODNA|nr:unnamed protein product [Rodentolepis nana]